MMQVRFRAITAKKRRKRKKVDLVKGRKIGRLGVGEFPLHVDEALNLFYQVIQANMKDWPRKSSRNFWERLEV